MYSLKTCYILDLNDVKNVKDPMSKVIPGLISTDNSLVELKEIHIRGKLVDLAGEVRPCLLTQLFIYRLL